MSQRSEQVAEELRKIVSMIFLEDLNDPRMGFITITHIQLTDDLRFARIYYSVLGDKAEKETAQAVVSENLGFIKKLAIERINMRYAMEIRFELDESIEHGARVDEILNKIKKKQT